MVVRDSAASRNSVVEIALSLLLSMGTSTNDFLKVWRRVPPAGKAGVDMIIVVWLKLEQDGTNWREE